MLSKVYSCGLAGIDGFLVEVEIDISNGLPAFDIVGLGDTAVKESRERVRAAIRNCGLEFPSKRITINLAPASLRKEGSSYDLPIAIGILIASGQLSQDVTSKYAFIGEISLSGEIKPVRGALSMAMCMFGKGIPNMIVPPENAGEASIVKGVNVYASSTLKDILNHLQGRKKLKKVKTDIEGLFGRSSASQEDFRDIRGQAHIKRALEVAAAGGHNVLMLGSPGSGKTMLAKRIPTILPDLSLEESMEVTRIYSAAGLLQPDTPLITKRPFRAPHHTASAASIIGGGRIPKPGEISLSHRGVLFLDEVTEFRPDVLESMRQPLEDRSVTISRVNTSISYPADVMLVIAGNPCRCGYYGSRSRVCTCTPQQIKQYRGRLSGPLLDRIDVQLEVQPVSYNELQSSSHEESSEEIKSRVIRCRNIQYNRYRSEGFYTNAQLPDSAIPKYCVLGKNESKLMREAFEKLGLSVRAYNRIIKTARTIADLEGSETIDCRHLAEAIQYRSFDRKLRVGQPEEG